MKTYSEKKIHIALRLFLQDIYNDQNEIQAVSKTPIVWGGLFGDEIEKHWKPFKKYLEMPLKKIDYKNLVKS